jgi:hypothetical protein
MMEPIPEIGTRMFESENGNATCKDSCLFASTRAANLPFFPVILLLLLFVAGCASNPAPKPAVLSLRSTTSGRTFAQSFPRAYFSQSDSGDREIILINDGFVAVKPTGGPLQPVATLPLQQIMHFKILWNPLPDTHTDAPSTTNAVIDWTISSSRPGVAGDSLHYRGAGFVQVDGGNDRLTLTIRNATIEPTAHSGSLVDPLGTCSINGSFTAMRNDGLVNAMVADLHAETTASPVEAAAQIDATEGGAPPRAPSGP